MALIDDVKQICDRIAPLGWRDLLLEHNLDITAKDLAAELVKPLTINRNLPGFTDFSASGNQAIQPGQPALSLLYHALASPNVHPLEQAYPTLQDIDTVENYIYSLTNRGLDDFPNAVIAVFAYQYRVGPRSPHRIHADMAYARVGVARVGTIPAHYDAARRSFWTGDDRALAVMPARYGAFLAIERTPSSEDVVLEAEVSDRSRRFLFPVHKLFAGEECLEGLKLSLNFLEYHRSEKLQRIHTVGNVPLANGFDLSQPPFIRDSWTVDDLVTLEAVNDSILVVPQDFPELVRPARQVNTETGQEEYARFRVPAANFDNRFWTSYQIAASGTSRQAPEYVNIRHRVDVDAAGKQTLTDLNQAIEDEDRFLDTLRQGGYEAVHFLDSTCDGVLTVTVEGIPQSIDSRPAYSLVTAPDFFPLADQIEIERWANGTLTRLRDHFSQGAPSPLSEGRQPANPDLDRPDDPSRKAFDLGDVTLPAIVGAAPTTNGPPLQDAIANSATSHLPDVAANVFAPGWEISLGATEQGETFYAAYGLGSPFPEDAKLCAALNSYWPAVAPDAARTFGLLFTPTALPLTDAELGYYPRHPKVLAGEFTSETGWDGEYGPFFEDVNGLQVNYANVDRSDYISNALAGQIRVNGLAEIDSAELIRRMEALRFCIRALPPTDDIVAETPLLLVVAEKITDWANRADRATPDLSGRGYLYEFANVDAEQAKVTRDVRRKRAPVLDRYTCQITAEGLFWQQNRDGAFRFQSR